MERLIKTLVSVILSLGIVFQASADVPTVKHIVKKNETVASIAERYGTTEAQILELNPDAAQMIYVGMELNVPVVTTTSTTQAQSENTTPAAVSNNTYTATNTNTNTSSTDNTAFTPYWDLGMKFGFGFPENNMTMDISMVGVYEFVKNGYFAVGAGYMGTNYSHSNLEVKFHYIQVPLEVGYRIGSTSFAIVPHAGLDLNLAVAKSAKYKKDSYDIDGGTFGLQGRAGVKLKFGGWTLGASYNIPLNDDMKLSVGEDGYFEASFGVGI